MKRIASNPLSTRLKMRFSTQHNRKTHPRARSRLAWVWRGFWGGLGAIALAGTVHGQQLGDRGEEVTRVQMRLQVLGYSQVQPTGVYDPVTQQAIQDFQLTHGLEADGIVGSQTRSLLFDNPNPNFVPIANQNSVSSIAAFPPEENVNPVDNAIAQESTFLAQGVSPRTLPLLKQGRQGEIVRYLQTLLRDRGFYFGRIDGDFGSQTLEAVRSFQEAFGLSQDGQVGPQTWGALLGNRRFAQPLNVPRPGVPRRSSLFRPPDRPYVVIVPGGFEIVDEMRAEGINVSFDSVLESRLGRYIVIERFESRELAESRSYFVRSQGFDARVIYD